MIKKQKIMWRYQQNSHLSGGLFLAAAAWQDLSIFLVMNTGRDRERSLKL